MLARAAHRLCVKNEKKKIIIKKLHKIYHKFLHFQFNFCPIKYTLL
jgi:hypothetical protein